jgi:TetR/AcrR family transcriptional regulator
MQRGKLPRREREKLRQRQEILDSALDLFSDKGYHNVSMHEIASEAEFAIGTLYKYFQNKEELYKTIILEECDKFDAAFTNAIDIPGDEVEKLRSYIHTKAARFRDNLAFVRLFLAESRGASYNINAGLDETVRKRYYEFLKRLSLVFESGIKKRRFKKIADPFYLSIALDSTVNAFLSLWLDSPEEHPFPDDPDTILKIFLEGLLDAR